METLPSKYVLFIFVIYLSKKAIKYASASPSLLSYLSLPPPSLYPGFTWFISKQAPYSILTSVNLLIFQTFAYTYQWI